MPKNNDPFEPWNDPIYKNDPFAPWNDPIIKNDPFACWNDPFGGGDYRAEVEKFMGQDKKK